MKPIKLVALLALFCSFASRHAAAQCYGYFLGTASAWSACPSSDVTLYESTFIDTPITLQWQISPDSLTWTNLSGATTRTFIAPGISSITYYRLISSCPYADVHDTSNTVIVHHSSSCFCTPAYLSPADASDAISFFSIAGEGGSGISDDLTPFGTMHYIDRTADVAPVIMKIGNSYSGEVHYPSFSGNYENEIWIDFNDDNVFSAGENITDTFGNWGYYATVIPYTAHIPATVAGIHRMRIRGVTVGLASSALDPCAYSDVSGGMYYGGLTADYTANIIADTTPAPGTFIVTIDSTCSGPAFGIVIDDSDSSAYSMKTYFGDGSSDSLVAVTSSGLAFIDFFHAYSASGVYTIKHILYHDGVAIDSMEYSYHYLLCNAVMLNFYYDVNGDCVRDSGDMYMCFPETVEVDSDGIVIDTISATSGYYYFARGAAGDVYSFRVIGTPGDLHVSCPISATLYDTLSISSPDNILYFAMTCDSSAGFDLSVHPATNATTLGANTTIAVYNTYCNATDDTVTMTFSPKYALDLSGIVPAPAAISGNAITWYLPVGSSTYFSPYLLWVSMHPATTLTAGDTAQFSFSVTPTHDDVDTVNNFAQVADSIRGSYDPNVMSVFPSGHILSGTQLQYTIGFENTGNDTAFNIYVMDTLSPNVNIKSLQLVAASAVMYTSQFTDSAGNHILKFDFPGINLLDSSHHGLCNGMVVFNIKAKDGLPDGTTIFNHAGIFFDDNPVVLTDTVEDIIGIPSTSASHIALPSVKVYPNPVHDRIVVEGAQKGDIVIMYNILGEQVNRTTIANTRQTISITGLAPGMYVVQVKDNTGTVSNTRITKTE